MASRLAVYPALPPGGKQELVLFEAEHFASNERALPGDRQRQNPNHHRAIAAIGMAFRDAQQCGDAVAREWLEGCGQDAMLEEKGRGQRK